MKNIVEHALKAKAPSQSRTFKAAMLSSGQFLVTLTRLVSAALLSRILTKGGYAAYKQTFLVYSLVTPLLTLGLPNALFFFLPRDKENGRSILSGNLLLLFLMGCLFAVAIWCGGNELLAKRFNNPALSRLLLIYSPYAALVLPVGAISACLVSSDRVKILTIYNFVSRMIVFVFVVGLTSIWRTPDAAVSGAVAAAFLVFFPAIFLMYRATNGDDWRPNRTNMWEQVKCSVPLGLAGMMGIITRNLSQALVSSICTPEEFAVYVNGAIEIPLIGVITGSVISVLMPEFSRMYQRDEYSQIISLWQRAMVKCALFVFPIMIFLFVAAPEVIGILFSAKYIESVKPFRVYLLLLPIRITSFGAIFMAAGKNSLVLYRSAIEIVLSFMLSIILLRVIGYVGAAVAMVLVVFLWSIPYDLFYIARILNISARRVMPMKALMKVMIISLASSIVFLSSPLFRSLGDFLYLIILGGAYTMLVMALFEHFKLIKTRDILGRLRIGFRSG